MVEIEIDNQIENICLGEKDDKDPFRVLHFTTIHNDDIHIWLSPENLLVLKNIMLGYGLLL